MLFHQSSKAGLDYKQPQRTSGDPFSNKEHLMDMGSSSSPGKHQPQSLKDMVIGGGKPSTFYEKSTNLSAMEASSSDSVSSACSCY